MGCGMRKAASASSGSQTSPDRTVLAEERSAVLLRPFVTKAGRFTKAAIGVWYFLGLPKVASEVWAQSPMMQQFASGRYKIQLVTSTISTLRSNQLS